MLAMFLVYTKPDCVQCRFTIRWLTAHHIDFEQRSALDYLDQLKAQGFRQLPVVIDPAHDVSWSGFQPTRLAQYLT